MEMRKLGPFGVNSIGLGCMNLSHAYNSPPPREAGEALLRRALELGVDHFDSAALYGFGANEKLIAPILKPCREDIVLVSKCGMRGRDGVRTISGDPSSLRTDLEASLSRLQTDVIDLYYLHRLDPKVPIEESTGELSRMVEEGKIRAIGLSEVSAETIRRAHNVHPIAAVQSEYSLWSRNVEIAVLDVCEELDIAFVAFSPLARGFLTAVELQPAEFSANDIRRGMPRFQPPHFSKNCALRAQFLHMAARLECSAAALALAWVLHQSSRVVVIPGTTSMQHLEENMGAGDLRLSTEDAEMLSHLFSPNAVSGPRYAAATQAEIDTEEFSLTGAR